MSQGHSRTLTALVVATCLTTPCRAQEPSNEAPPSVQPPGSDHTTQSAAKKRTRRQKLPDLPKPPSRRLPPPSKQTLDEVKSTLKRLVSRESSQRQTGLERLLSAQAKQIAAARHLLDRAADRADRRAMKRLLIDIRRKTRKRLKQKTPTGDIETPDYLVMVLSSPLPDDAAWRQLVHVLALSRLCSGVGTVEAVRTLIRVYVRFDFLRIDTQLRLAELGDRAVAALIETTRHPAPKVVAWAEKRLERRGLNTPGDMVQIKDSQALADVLRALGRLRDPELARVLLSFAKSERMRVREAARQAVVLVGNVGLWPLRDAYASFVGSKAPREWSWDRVARELFYEYDQVRHAEITDLYNAGLIAWETGNTDAMVAKFNQVLTRAPEFNPKNQLIAGYRHYLQESPGLAPEQRAVILTRILRLAEDDPMRRWAMSRLTVYASQRLLTQDIADRVLLNQAAQFDPNNETAQSLLSSTEATPLVERQSFVRYLWPSVLASLSMLFAAIVLLRRRGGTRSSN